MQLGLGSIYSGRSSAPAPGHTTRDPTTRSAPRVWERERERKMDWRKFIGPRPVPFTEFTREPADVTHISHLGGSNYSHFTLLSNMGMSAVAAAREHSRIETFHRRNLHSGRSSAALIKKAKCARGTFARFLFDRVIGSDGALLT